MESVPLSPARESKELLRFITCGSVDDGKSTLIGRLLYRVGAPLRRPARDASIRLQAGGRRAASSTSRCSLDGLAAEREQGITIDVAYRYFTTLRRNFIVADTPGHEQFRATWSPAPRPPTAPSSSSTRATGWSRRRAVTVHRRALGLRHVAFAINKLDLVDYAEARFREIEGGYLRARRRDRAADVSCIPVSACAATTSSSAAPRRRGTTARR